MGKNIPPQFVTITGLLTTIWFAFTHPGQESSVCAALAALWGYTHNTYGKKDES